MRNINNVKLYVNNNEKAFKVSKQLEEELKQYNFNIVDDNPDICISVGGDGSFLRMVKSNNFNDQISYIGINVGTLGFLQEIDIEDTKDFVKRLNDNDYKNESVNIQETIINTEEKNYIYNSLNEIVIRNEDLDTLKIPIYIDDELFEEFSGDGVLVSTSTGSTAYNMSFGGSIVYNTLNTLSITPIAPLNNKAYSSLRNSLIVPGDKEIEFRTKEGFKNLLVSIDGTKKVYKDVSHIETYISKKKINCLRMNEFHFIKVVNNKLLSND